MARQAEMVSISFSASVRVGLKSACWEMEKEAVTWLNKNNEIMRIVDIEIITAPLI